MTKIIIMLIWTGMGNTQAQSTIQGFNSLEACERAKPIISRIWSRSPQLDCVALDKS